MSFFERVSQTKTLIILAVASQVLGVVMLVPVAYFDIIVLDQIFSADKAREAIQSMDSFQLNLHAFGTGTADVLFPLLYVSLLAGLLYRLFPEYGTKFAAIALLLLPIDASEGAIQFFALSLISTCRCRRFSAL